MMSGQNRVLDLGNHGLVIADNSGQYARPGFQTVDQILTHLIADGKDRDTTFSQLP
jgi:hypothetical protein